MSLLLFKQPQNTAALVLREFCYCALDCLAHAGTHTFRCKHVPPSLTCGVFMPQPLHTHVQTRTKSPPFPHCPHPLLFLTTPTQQHTQYQLFSLPPSGSITQAVAPYLSARPPVCTHIHMTTQHTATRWFILHGLTVLRFSLPNLNEGTQKTTLRRSRLIFPHLITTQPSLPPPSFV